MSEMNIKKTITAVVLIIVIVVLAFFLFSPDACNKKQSTPMQAVNGSFVPQDTASFSLDIHADSIHIQADNNTTVDNAASQAALDSVLQYDLPPIKIPTKNKVTQQKTNYYYSQTAGTGRSRTKTIVDKEVIKKEIAKEENLDQGFHTHYFKKKNQTTNELANQRSNLSNGFGNHQTVVNVPALFLDQKVKNGGHVKIKMQRALIYKNITIPAGTYIGAQVYFLEDRAMLKFSTINVSGMVIDIECVAFCEEDGLEGLPVDPQEVQNSLAAGKKEGARSLITGAASALPGGLIGNAVKSTTNSASYGILGSQRPIFIPATNLVLRFRN